MADPTDGSAALRAYLDQKQSYKTSNGVARGRRAGGWAVPPHYRGAFLRTVDNFHAADKLHKKYQEVSQKRAAAGKPVF